MRWSLSHRNLWVVMQFNRRLVDKWYKNPLVIALFASCVIHALILGFKFQKKIDAERRLKTPLSVVLLNAHSQIEPLKPKRLAQSNLNGGGEAQTDAMALKPADIGVAQRLDELQKEQKRLLSSLKAKQDNAASSYFGKSAIPKAELDPLEAELGKRLVREGRAPRKAILTATSAKSVIYAQYYDSMRRKVESYGTRYFPRVNNAPLYGSLVILLSVNAQGRIVAKPEIKKSSGNAMLDRQALSIVNACEPFGVFPPAMHAQLDMIDWIATFEFIKGGDTVSQLHLKESK